MYVKGISVPTLAVNTELVTQKYPFKRLPHVLPPAVAIFQASYIQFIQVHLANLSKRFIIEITCPTTQQRYKEVGQGYKTGCRITAKITLSCSDNQKNPE